MASKTIEEYLRKATPEQKAALQQEGQKLQENGSQVKPINYDPQPMPRQAAQARTTEPQISEPISRRLEIHQHGTEKIQQAQAEAYRLKTHEPTQSQQKIEQKAREPER